MVGSGDHRPSLSQVVGTVCPLQVNFRADPTRAGSGEALLMVTRSAGGGLEGQVTAQTMIQKRVIVETNQ